MRSLAFSLFLAPFMLISCSARGTGAEHEPMADTVQLDRDAGRTTQPAKADETADGQRFAEEGVETWPAVPAAAPPPNGPLELRRAWARKGLSSAVVRTGASLRADETEPTILALDKGGELVHLSARDGRDHWRVKPPDALDWYGIAAGRELAVVGQRGRANSSYRSDETLVRLVDGHVLWHAEQPDFAHLELAVDGTGLVRTRYSMAEPECPVQPLDPRSGQIAGPLIPGVQVRQQGERDHYFICDTAASVLTADEQRTVMAIRAAPTRIEAYALAPPEASRPPTPLWTVPLSPQQSEVVHHVPELGLVVARGSRELVIARIALDSGAVRWLRRFPWRDCPAETRQLARYHGTGELVRRAPGPSGRRDSLLVQTCTDAHLLSLSSGRSRWQQPVTDALVHVLGEPARALDGYSLLLNSGGNITSHGPFVDGQLRFLWMNPQGQKMSQWETPRGGILQAQPAAEGGHAVLYNSRALEMRERDGAVRWRIELDREGYLREVTDGVVIVSAEYQRSSDFVVIDARDGQKITRIRDAMQVLARLPPDAAHPENGPLLVFAQRSGGLVAMHVRGARGQRSGAGP